MSSDGSWNRVTVAPTGERLSDFHQASIDWYRARG
jgi:hypothetical protein